MPLYQFATLCYSYYLYFARHALLKYNNVGKINNFEDSPPFSQHATKTPHKTPNLFQDIQNT